MKRRDNKPSYPFAWMEEALEVTLNPQISQLTEMEGNQISDYVKRFDLECTSIIEQLNNLTFALLSAEQIGTMITLYDTAIALLQAKAESNRNYYPESGQLFEMGTMIIRNLQTLRQQLHIRYSPFYNKRPTTKVEPFNAPGDKPKVTCRLTVDQLGIILKAADESRLIFASSLSMIFKTIVPYLSTVTKQDLSWDSMRSNAYHPESRDKETVLSALEMLIKTIKEY